MRMLIKRCLKHLKDLKAEGKFGRLTIEIALILVVKALLLWLIWALCFSHPIPKSARQNAVTSIILNNHN